MSDTCRFCGGPDEEDGQPTNSGTCGECFYEMRLMPDEFEARMEKLGRSAEYVGGCVTFAAPGGGSGIACRDPYAPAGEAPSEPVAGLVRTGYTDREGE